MHVGEIKGKVHVAIITVRPDEYAAMEDRLGETVSVEGGNNSYEYSVITLDGRAPLSVVLTRVVIQGNTPAQAVANNIIHEIDPAWLFLVGIAGSVPDHEFSLGDVIVASYLHEFSLKAVTEEKTQTYQSHGGPMHQAVERFLQTKIAGRNANRLLNLAGFLADSPFQAHPRVFEGATPNKSLFYGDDRFRNKVEEIITNRFPCGTRNGPPRIWAGPCANGDTLVKSAMLLQEWQESARQLAHVETELAGVYAAARSAGRQNYPLLAIRGLSDVVGLRRDPAWTAYACKTSAAFALAVLRSGFIDFHANLANEGIDDKPVPGSAPIPAAASILHNAALIPSAVATDRAAFWATDIARRIQEHNDIAFAQGDKEALKAGPRLQISTPAQKYEGCVRFARHDRRMGRIVVDPNSQDALRIDTDVGPEYVPMSEVNGVRESVPAVFMGGGHSSMPGPRSERYRGSRRGSSDGNAGLTHGSVPVEQFADLLPSNSGRVRLIQEVAFSSRNEFTLPQVEDVLTTAIRAVPQVLELIPQYVRQSPSMPWKKSIMPGNKGLVISIEYQLDTLKKLIYKIEFSRDCRLRLGEYVDDTRSNTPYVDIGYLAKRMASFALFAIRMGRAVGGSGQIGLRWSLHEVAGVTCKVGDWAMVDIVFGAFQAGAGLVKAPVLGGMFETQETKINCNDDSLNGISNLISGAIRELCYNFQYGDEGRSGLVRPSIDQVKQIIGSLYE